MDNKKLKELIKIFETSNIAEFSYKSEEGDRSEEVHLSKISANYTPQPIVYQNQQPVSSVPTSSNLALENLGVKDEPKNHNHIIRSPLVGTYYSSAKPGEKPFAEKGKKIAVGDVVCIIESMKVMNKIKAEKAGIVREIFIKDGMSVEFDEPILELE